MKPWSRLMWGIIMKGSDQLLFSGWVHPFSPRWDGEPTAPLLFQTRRQAYAWTREKHRFYGAYPIGHACRKWKFVVVRVKQTLTQVQP